MNPSIKVEVPKDVGSEQQSEVSAGLQEIKFADEVLFRDRSFALQEIGIEVKEIANSVTWVETKGVPDFRIAASIALSTALKTNKEIHLKFGGFIIEVGDVTDANCAEKFEDMKNQFLRFCDYYVSNHQEEGSIHVNTNIPYCSLKDEHLHALANLTGRTVEFPSGDDTLKVKPQQQFGTLGNSVESLVELLKKTDGRDLLELYQYQAEHGTGERPF